METALTETTSSTLLAALWANSGDESQTRADLKAGALKLTGNFKGHEQEVAEG